MSELAYLVIREGGKWSDVFRLIPGQAVTVGRAPTNQVVIRDERCSRNHVEVFFSGGQWTLRDLESRNGTLVGTERVVGDWPLQPGDVIRIGHCQLAFVHRLSEAFSGDSSAVLRPVADAKGSAGPTNPSNANPLNLVHEDDPASVLGGPTTIMHRRGQTRFLEPVEEVESEGSKVSRATGKLCRLAFELAKANDVASLADLALAGLAEETHTDAGAVLLLPRGHQGEPKAEVLEVVASRSSSPRLYQRVSNVLAATVMREGEAVLARNVLGDSTLGTRDSQGEIHTTSVICAGPPRQQGLRHRASLLDRRQPGSRSGRSGVHPGRGRHRGRGLGEPRTATSWPRTSPKCGPKTSSCASGWACKAK